jgi:hypothetical protein
MKSAYLFLLFKLLSFSIPAAAYLDVWCTAPAENSACNNDLDLIRITVGDKLNALVHDEGLVPEEKNLYYTKKQKKNLRVLPEIDVACGYCPRFSTSPECIYFNYCSRRHLSATGNITPQDACRSLETIARDALKDLAKSESVSGKECKKALEDVKCYCEV